VTGDDALDRLNLPLELVGEAPVVNPEAHECERGHANVQCRFRQHRTIPLDIAVGFQPLQAARARGFAQAYRFGETRVRDAAVPLHRCENGSVGLVQSHASQPVVPKLRW